jgi:hypothetical protein
MADWNIPPYLPTCLTLGGCSQLRIPTIVSLVPDKYSAEFKRWVELNPCSGVHLQGMNKKKKLTNVFCPMSGKISETRNVSKYDGGKKRIWPCRKSKFGLRNLKIFTTVTQRLEALHEIQTFDLCNACRASSSVQPPPPAFNWTNSVQFWTAATRSIGISIQCRCVVARFLSNTLKRITWWDKTDPACSGPSKWSQINGSDMQVLSSSPRRGQCWRSYIKYTRKWISSYKEFWLAVSTGRTVALRYEVCDVFLDMVLQHTSVRCVSRHGASAHQCVICF